MKTILLGTSAAVADAQRDNASLLVNSGGENILVDCPGSIIPKLKRVGVDPFSLRNVILTHDHVDHIYGLPSLIHGLLHRCHELRIFGPQQCLETAQAILSSLRLLNKKYPPVRFVPLPNKEDVLIFENELYTAHATPAQHSRKTIAVRFREKVNGKAFVYASDTRRSDRIARFAQGVHTLFHDCSAPHRLLPEVGSNHSTALQAAEVAELAGVKRLVLVHIDPTREFREEELLQEAEKYFSGEVEVPQDFQEFNF